MTLVGAVRVGLPLGDPVSARRSTFVAVRLGWGFVLGFLCGLLLCDVREAELLYPGEVNKMQQLFEVSDGVFAGITRVEVPRQSLRPSDFLK